MRISKEITINPGTPVKVEANPRLALDLMITPRAGAGAALIVVYSGGIAFTELAPATATVPGGVLHIDRSWQGAPKLDVSEFSIDGSHGGDKVLVSYDPS